MKIIDRDMYLNTMIRVIDTPDIKVITGVRRSGKSSILQLIINELLESGVNESNIIDINLEKRGFISIRSTKALDAKINELVALSNRKVIKYLFIDEIQYIEGFEELINSYRAEGEFSIFITGSNSYLLSSEISTRLTGRYISLEVFTLNFE